VSNIPRDIYKLTCGGNTASLVTDSEEYWDINMEDLMVDSIDYYSIILGPLPRIAIQKHHLPSISQWRLN
jgi:hypothetical protein